MATKMEEYTKATAGNFLSAQKAKDNNLVNKALTIIKVEWTEIGDTMKPILSFEGTDMTLALNKGNAAVLSDAFGVDETKWVGKHVQLVITKKQFQGTMVDGITVIAV